MRLVVDTNVLISALLNPGRTPDLALTAALAARAVVLVDDRIAAEYRTVLARPKFAAIEPARREALLASVLDQAEWIAVARAFVGELIDQGDRAFVEVAIDGRADVIVTGNLKHYPSDLGVDVLGPTALLARLTGRGAQEVHN